MSKFENMNAKEIAICLEAFYEASQKYSGTATLAGTTVYFRSGKEPIHIYRSDFDEGIKILREDYEVFWTPDTKPDDLKWKINERRMKELDEHIRKNAYIDTDHVLKRFAASEHFEDELATLLGLPFGSGRKDLYDAIAKLKHERDKLHEWKKRHQVIENSWYGTSTGVTFAPGCVVTGNDYLYRRELGLPDNATVVDILKKIRGLKQDNTCLATDLEQIHGHYRAMLDALDCKTVKDNVGALNKVRELMVFKRDASRLVGMDPSDGALAIFEHLADRIHSHDDVAKERDEADRLRRHWHAKYEDEHKECVRLSKLHAADKEKKDKQDVTIHNLRDNNTTLEYSVAALKKRIRSMDAEAAEKETKNKVITDTLRDNLVDSIEECKKLNGRIRLLEDQLKLNGVPPLEDPLNFNS